MQKQKFDEIISYVNKKVSEMEIETKYKMELLGMVTALGYAHEKETHDKRTEMHACDCISRQGAIDAVEESRRLNHHQDGKAACAHEYEHRHFLKLLRDLPSAQPERKTGVWESTDDGWDGEYFVCSVCGCPWTLIEGSPEDNGMNFCPNCGADMRGTWNEKCR